MALPPQIMAALGQPAIGSAGPAGPRTGNPGAEAEAMVKIRDAIHLLEMALPSLQVGSEPHKVVLKMIQDGAKLAPASQEQAGLQQTSLAGLQDRAKQMQMLQQLQTQQQGGGAQPQAAPQAQPQPGM